MPAELKTFALSVATESCVNLGDQCDRGNEDNQGHKKINGNLGTKVTVVTKVAVSITQHW
jgi:hypothetical protein